MTELPEGWRIRRPVLDDVPEILRLAHASDIAAVGEPDFTTEEVREALTAPHTDPARDCWLALDAAGEIVGWAYPSNASAGDRDFLEVYVWPERGVPALRPLLALLLARATERGREFGHDPYTVRAGAIPTEQPWISALTDAGFAFLKQHARMTMPLTAAQVTVPEPAPGVTVRPVRPDDEDELRRFHATIAEAFRDSDHPATDYETWRKRLADESSISWDEWFVGEVDGQWAGVLQSSDSSAADNDGWVRSLGVLRPYRRRGVGAALLHRAFAAYAAKGRTTAGLGVDLANPTQAARLYRAVGMRPLYEANIYQRTV
ncbi:GNAT family N-acetyltransferase [Actinoplanes sp. ATCC 53533]|uniref:GNAT family N-acetyltransferase n=1 Tax=Actinoplanes sp. ATCC 53533 TaxID=1288362 RepID=UPI000F77C8E0|nr:GNAT family N-acetyltransferase [Actinoplanes sp. ATCC 53533]RSM65193.1 GNAT family N-acetyltransferase [Actinoplanes sp. ATCC 53533]